MTKQNTEKPRRGLGKHRRRFRVLDLAIVVLVIAAAAVFTYPVAAQWVYQYNQANVILDQTKADRAQTTAFKHNQITKAQHYNELLKSGAIYPSGKNIAEGTGSVAGGYDYYALLSAVPTGIMARLRIPAIKLDLPVYHGTSEKTLLRGIGHLKGTSLPVGGVGSHSVLTAHRGLASAELFTNLNKMKKGDTFTAEVFGEAFTYKVSSIRVISPSDTQEIRAIPGKDLMTLVTCTPLGINSHRILVTGERVIPTPQKDIAKAGGKSDLPHFPWWIVAFSLTVIIAITWYCLAGRTESNEPKRALK